MLDTPSHFHDGTRTILARAARGAPVAMAVVHSAATGALLARTAGADASA